MIADRPAPADVVRSERPMRLAVVYCRNPLPMRRSDQITVAHLIEFLHARGHLVDLFCLDGDGQVNRDNALAPADIAWLEERCVNVSYVHQDRGRALLGAFAALIAAKPLQVGWLNRPQLSKALSAALGETRYDVIYAYYFRSAETVVSALKRSRWQERRVPTVLAMQLSQTLNTRRIRDESSSLPTRILFGLESRLISRYEARIWRKFDRTALIGPADVEAIAKECRAQGLPTIDNWFYSPHGTDVTRFRPKPSLSPAPGTVLFAGTLFYPPNIQAATWLAKSIWPLVRERLPEARLRIVGRDPASEVVALNSYTAGVEVIANVPDMSEYMLQASVCVNPVRAAGGMQNKLIEYLSSGRPVVATSIANEGVRAPSGVLRFADSASQFADAIVELLENPSVAEEMGRQAREYALKVWSWEAHFLELESHLAQLSQGSEVDPS